MGRSALAQLARHLAHVRPFTAAAPACAPALHAARPGEIMPSQITAPEGPFGGLQVQENFKKLQRCCLFECSFQRLLQPSVPRRYVHATEGFGDERRRGCGCDQVPSRLLMGPGPANAHPRVLAAQSLPLLGHMHPPFLALMDEIQAGLRYIFQTKSQYTLMVSGSGHAGEAPSSMLQWLSKCNCYLYSQVWDGV